MKVKRVILSVVLALALCTPIVEPCAVTNTTTVVQAKKKQTFAKFKKSVLKKYRKIKKGMSYEKVCKILGKEETDVFEETEYSDGTEWIYDWKFKYSKSKYVTITISFYNEIVKTKYFY